MSWDDLPKGYVEEQGNAEVGMGPGGELDMLIEERVSLGEKKRHMRQEIERLEAAQEQLAKKSVELMETLQSRLKASGA